MSDDIDERLSAIRDRRDSAKARAPDSWWYYAKKAVPLFPGIDVAARGPLLDDYYGDWERLLGPTRRMLNRAVLAGFRRWVPRRARRMARRYGLDEGWAREASERAARHVVDPLELAMFRIKSDEEAGRFLRSFEWAEITKRINPAQWHKDCVLAHKIDFHLAAATRDLPLPKLHAVSLDGDITVVEPTRDDSVFVKADTGRGGKAAFALSVPETARCSEAALRDYLASTGLLAKGDWIVQQRLAIHPDLAPLAMNALPTVRLITILDERGEPEIVVTYLRFPSSDAVVVDNFAAGGLMGWIDPGSGVMGKAVIKRDLADHSHHPANGAPIEGRQVPLWDETTALAIRAHRAFPNYAMIGWDVAITPDGPVIVEGNGKPCAQGAQQAQHKGMGETRFGELVAWHLAEAQRR